jgi:uncharacterized membrane protein
MRRRRYSGLPLGTVLQQSLTITLANLPSFLLLAFVTYLPVFALSWYAPEILLAIEDPDQESVSPGHLMFGLLAFAVLPWILEALLAGMMTYTVVQQLRGRRAPLGESIRRALQAVSRLLGTGLLAGLLYMLGSLLFLIPGIILRCKYAVAIPTSVIEGTGATKSLGRSSRLTDGSKWPIFFVFFVLGLFSYLITLVIDILLQEQLTAGSIEPSLYILLRNLPLPLFGMWSGSAICVMYYHLRHGKEQIDVEQLAAVFD